MLSLVSQHGGAARQDGNASVRGTVEAVLFGNHSTGFGVIRLRTDGGMPVRAVGPIAELVPGENVTIVGAWVEHPVWGRQLRTTDLARHLPGSIAGIRSFLSGGLVKGVGPALADRLVATFGERTLEVIESEPGRLSEIRGLGTRRRAWLVESVSEYRGLRDLAVLLGNHGIASSTASRLWKARGLNALSIVRTDPYRLIGLVPGISFKTADALALRMGLDPVSHKRRRAALLHVVDQATQAGHVHLPWSEVSRRTGALIGDRIDPDEGALVTLVLERHLVVEGVGEAVRVFAPELHAQECDVARRLAGLAAAAPRMARAGKPAVESVGFAERLDTEQRAALEQLLSSNVLVITGPPGTGKTTVVRALHAWLARERCSVALAAPTGRAARRLAEVVGAPAMTLHRLLGLGREEREATGTRPLRADAVVVDEASMVDLPLFSALLRRMAPGKILVLVGDEDQLPSVGPGAVLADIMSSRIVPVARLSKIFRQGPGSGIVRGADCIRRGVNPLQADLGSELAFVRRDDPAGAAGAIVDLAASEPGAQVLSPMNSGQAGVRALNDLLRHRLVPGAMPIGFGEGGLHVGDRVIHLANDYRRELFNGDVGQLVSAHPASRQVVVEFAGRCQTFEERDLVHLAPAFALSVHKAQGSEYPVIVMPVLSEHSFLLRRNLLYTAVTRARKKAFLVGSLKALALAVRHDRVELRHTGLAERLRARAERGSPTPARGALQ